MDEVTQINRMFILTRQLQYTESCQKELTTYVYQVHVYCLTVVLKNKLESWIRNVLKEMDKAALFDFIYKKKQQQPCKHNNLLL
jgi:hypothetical protein